MATIGMLTGGGDCPGLNAVLRGVVMRAETAGYDCIGFLEGWRGIVEGLTPTKAWKEERRGASWVGRPTAWP